MPLYLDSNAHLPIHSKAAKAYSDFSESIAGYGHASSPSEPGRQAAFALEQARSNIASLIGALTPSQIVFTSGCTQACSWAMQLLFESEMGRDGVTSSPFEHPAIRDAYEYNLKEQNPKYLTVDQNGIVQPNEVNKVVCLHTHNELGVIQDLNTIKRVCLFSDMSQSLGKIPLNVTDLNVDFAVFASHKFRGPGGHGFMYVKNLENWKPYGTGSRYFFDRPGTPDVASAVAASVALEEAISSLEYRTKNMLAFREILESGLEKLSFEIIGKLANRCPNTTFVRMPDLAAKALFELGDKGIYTGLGSACGSMHSGNSAVIKAIGLKEGRVGDFMRISQWGEYSEQEAKFFIKTLEKIVLK